MGTVVEEDVPDQTFQFPFRRDVLCNVDYFRVFRPGSLMFQFPFRRDVLCNLHLKPLLKCCLVLFQFPFRRDVLCNIISRRLPELEGVVSIPFSSGCALQ